MHLSKAKVMITGASRGLGAALAEGLARRGADLLLVARSQTLLERVAEVASKHKTRVLTLTADLQDPKVLERVVEHGQRELGAIDVLVNNAGVESSGYFEDLEASEIQRVTDINLNTPMLLTRLVLPDMLKRNRGHVLNIASIAGLAAFPFGETYAATKHGLVGFNRALRASLKGRNSQVSASVLCPGFVFDTGLYKETRDLYGVEAHWLVGGCSSEEVVRAAVSAIRWDRPEVVVNSTPIRGLAALSMALPRVSELVTRRLDVFQEARRLAELRRGK